MKHIKQLIAVLIGLCVFASSVYVLSVKGSIPEAWLDILFLFILAVVSISDLYTMTIPDTCHILLLVIGTLSAAVSPAGLSTRLLGAVIISLPLFLLASLTGGFGGGDVKLCASCGFYLGTSLTVFGALSGTILAAAAATLLLLTGKAEGKDQICFGPFLSFGFGFSLLFGRQLIDQYLLLLL